MTKAILALVTIALLCFAQTISAAEHEDDDTPKASDSKAGSKDKSAKKDEPSDNEDEEDEEEEDGPSESAGKSESGVAMADLVHDGFVIRTTVFVPAEAVTRQTGKVSGDAIVVTLQKQFSTAVCYYSFKAYVKEGLTAIASCTVYR